MKTKVIGYWLTTAPGFSQCSTQTSWPDSTALRRRGHRGRSAVRGPGPRGPSPFRRLHRSRDQRSWMGRWQSRAPHGRLNRVLRFTITCGKIVQIDVVADPARLTSSTWQSSTTDNPTHVADSQGGSEAKGGEAEWQLRKQT
jgi:hypothetical protein